MELSALQLAFQSTVKLSGTKDHAQPKTTRNQSDQVDISKAGQSAVEDRAWLKPIVHSMPGVREDAVSAVRDKVSQGYYNQQAVIEKIAIGLMDVVG